MDSKTFDSVSQAELLELTERCLRGNSYIALRNITCEYVGGVLVLRGCVETYYLKQVAQSAVAQVPGVEPIDNQIQVVPPPRHAQRD